jgi:hypothetical protein
MMGPMFPCKHWRSFFPFLVIVSVFTFFAACTNASAETLIAWNNLGMHCLDADYAVFSLLPPYNTVHAQLIGSTGRLVSDDAGWRVTYEAIADPTGSINSTAVGKTNFWSFVEFLFGVRLPLDVGLAGTALPGATNAPQPLRFDPEHRWFVAEGIPVVPYDDTGAKNPYPTFLVVARDRTGAVRASTTVVTPVSDEMDCRACHASGSSPAAAPSAGWVNDPDPQRDMRLNILLLHDERESSNPLFARALAEAGYDPAGLYPTARSGRPILCARCHASEALPGSGMRDVSALTQAIHRRMAWVADPDTLEPLNASTNRNACYRCHPGAATRCLRGVMGNAVAPDGARAIQCQSCHGNMLQVASPDRRGWIDEPRCQSCHTGTAVQNRGAIRFESVFTEDNVLREPQDPTFATNSDTPVPGAALYRFSKGHGGIACEACHGPTHAEYPSSHENDNLQSIALQGHVGTLSECSTCHPQVPAVPNGGPHGLHPLGASWVQAHGELAEHGGVGPCRDCHGADYRGTELSRALGDRVLQTKFGTKVFWRGFQVGCYACHNGPSSEAPARNRAPEVSDAEARLVSNAPTLIPIAAVDSDGDPVTLRVVTQPSHGTAAVREQAVLYTPEPGYLGEDTFTIAAWDGSTNSNLATVRVTVAEQSCAGDCNGDGSVTIDELVLQVRIALGEADITACSAADANNDRQVTIDEIVRSVNQALLGCG